jgi:cell division protein FtsB
LSAGYYLHPHDAHPPVSIWQRINRLLWVLLILAMVGMVIGAFLPELQEQRNERQKRDELRRQIDEQQDLHDRLARQIDWLNHSPEYLSIFAREKLEMKQEGETILRMEPSKSTEPAEPVPMQPRRIAPLN